MTEPVSGPSDRRVGRVAPVGPQMPFRDYPSERLMRAIEAAPLPANIADLLRTRTRAHPDAVLLSLFDDDDVLTYRDFSDAVARLASSLAALGIGHGTHVGVMVHTTRTYPITWFALATLGAVTVPINPAFTARELSYVLSDAACRGLVIEPELLPLLESIDPSPLPDERVVVVADAPARYRSWTRLLETGDPTFSPERPPAPHDLLNIQYTSGTTGFPKGAMLSHLGLLTHGRIGAAQALDEPKNILVAQPFHYITGQWQFLMAMFQGGTAFMPRRQSSTRFMDWVKQYRIHYCNFPEIVARQPERPDDSANDLRVLYCYSHVIENYRAYEQRYGCLARSGFSMTETALVTYVPHEADHMTGTGTVGIPVAFREVRICDPEGTTVPDGELGEICVRGPGMLLGYYNKPEATREAFHPDGWFRTGDLGRRSPEGWFWYLGRMKDMVKRSGENVSATEVEAILRGVEGILEAAIVPVPDPMRGEEVKAYLLLAEGRTREDTPPGAIIAHCSTQLARYKIPRYLEYVSEFPRTATGKIRKADLKAAKSDLRSGSYDVQDGRWVA